LQPEHGFELNKLAIVQKRLSPLICMFQYDDNLRNCITPGHANNVNIFCVILNTARNSEM